MNKLIKLVLKYDRLINNTHKIYNDLKKIILNNFETQTTMDKIIKEAKRLRDEPKIYSSGELGNTIKFKVKKTNKNVIKVERFKKLLQKEARNEKTN